MEHKSENRICQNCKKDFTIEPDDFSFYEKIQVPPPTFCPECRFQRRMAWRNERILYKRLCDMCKKSTISMYPTDTIFPVYCKDCWYSDKWDSTEYGKDYDFSKSFFDNFKIISNIVPRIAIFQRNVINSEYSNMVGESKNVYLSVSVVLGSENIFYSRSVDKSFNIVDSYNIKESDSCYEDIEGDKNYNTQYTVYSRNCLDSYFLVDCVNCSNCFMSYNLRNKQFCIRNQQYNKEDYFKEISNINLGSRKSRELLINEFNILKKRVIYRYANIMKSVDSTGNDLLNVNNCKNCFEVNNSENVKYCYRILNSKDYMDATYAGRGELLYEYCTGSLNDYNVKFSYSAFDSVQNAEYVESCIVSKNLFGCISIKNKENVILNKVYSKDEYTILREKILEQMNEVPYIDKKGRVYRYGEFFPIEISSFAYNETMSNDFIPLNKEQVLKEGYKWREPENKNHIITIHPNDIIDSIDEVGIEITKEVIGCIHEEKCDHHCLKAFKITDDEFKFYKKNNIPIPNRCSNCRYYERFAQILPPKLWHRNCMNEGCTNEFETSYAPDRPETIYCERCYQQTVC